MDIQMEKVLEAVFDKLFVDADDCSKAESAFYMLDTIKRENNAEIIRQLGDIQVPPCNPNCSRRKCANRH